MMDSGGSSKDRGILFFFFFNFSQCLLFGAGPNLKRRDEVMWVGVWVGVLEENSVLGNGRDASCGQPR
jgi:hypothetical protein